jgi:hypothetical protein
MDIRAAETNAEDIAVDPTLANTPNEQVSPARFVAVDFVHDVGHRRGVACGDREPGDVCTSKQFATRATDRSVRKQQDERGCFTGYARHEWCTDRAFVRGRRSR